MSIGTKTTSAKPAAPVAEHSPAPGLAAREGLVAGADAARDGMLASLNGIVERLERVLGTALTAEQRRHVEDARDAAATVRASMEAMLSVASTEAAPVRHSHRPAPPAPATRPLEVLVVEDNEVNQRVMVAVLESAGHNVTLAGTGVGALTALGERPFDVVLMDLQMPDMDGLEATRRLRAKERTVGRHTPVIALTARAMEGDIEACLAAGADDYVSKPFEIDALLEAIDSAVHKRDPASAAEAASVSPSH